MYVYTMPVQEIKLHSLSEVLYFHCTNVYNEREQTFFFFIKVYFALFVIIVNFTCIDFFSSILALLNMTRFVVIVFFFWWTFFVGTVL